MIVGFENYRDKYNFDDVTGVIHVGAHSGQEYEDYILNFGHIKTHWFEPSSKSFSKLKSRISGAGGVKLYNFALGKEFGKIQMWEDEGNDGKSSSLLEPKEHLNEWEHIKFKRGEFVEVRTLDSFLITDSNVLVLDVQGYELEVLKGAKKTIESRINHIFLEINQKEMYSNCPTVSEISNFLEELRFEQKEIWWTENSWGDGYWRR